MGSSICTLSSTVPNVVWRQWSDQYVSIILISVMVGSRRSSSRKYCWQNAMSASSMASPRSAMNAARPAVSSSQKPSIVSTGSGSGNSCASVATGSSDASRASTGLMTYFFTVAMSSSESAPSSTYTLALRTSGRSPWLMSWMHWLAESARWSNCPGSASTANTVASAGMGASRFGTSFVVSMPTAAARSAAIAAPAVATAVTVPPTVPASGRMRDVLSVWGSLNTVGTHCSNSPSEMPSTS